MGQRIGFCKGFCDINLEITDSRYVGRDNNRVSLCKKNEIKRRDGKEVIRKKDGGAISTI